MYTACPLSGIVREQVGRDSGDVDDVFSQVGVRQLWEIARKVWGMASMCKAFPSMWHRLVVIRVVVSQPDMEGLRHVALRI